MRSEVKTYAYPDGNIQRVQTISWEDWSGLDFLSPTPTDDALDCFAHIYRNFLVPQAPWMFGHLVMFRLPENLPELSFRTKKYGTLSDPLTAAAAERAKSGRGGTVGMGLVTVRWMGADQTFKKKEE